MQKIKLDHLDQKMNHRQALHTINSGGMSRKGLYCNFIRDNDQCYCLITLSEEERFKLPKALKDSIISYKNLKAIAYS